MAGLVWVWPMTWPYINPITIKHRNGKPPIIPELKGDYSMEAVIEYRYAIGNSPAHYPVPAIDYYNSSNPLHLPIGNMMEWSIPVETQLKFAVKPVSKQGITRQPGIGD